MPVQAHGWHEATMLVQSLADPDRGTTRLSVEWRSRRIAIAGVKQSCGRKCARLVDWLSFLRIPQIIGKGAHGILGRMPIIEIDAAQFASFPRESHRPARGPKAGKPLPARVVP